MPDFLVTKKVSLFNWYPEFGNVVVVIFQFWEIIDDVSAAWKKTFIKLMREDLDVAGATTGDGELEPTMGREFDLLGVGDRSLVEDVVSLTKFASRVVGNHTKVGMAILGEVFALKFSKETRRIASDFVIVCIDVASIKCEGWSADNLVSKVGIIGS